MIDLDARPVTTHPSRLVQVRRALSAPAPAVLVVAVTVLLAAFLRASAPAPVARQSTPAADHLVQVGVSAYPATVVAQWIDSADVAHPLDPWMDRGERLPARAVVVAVSAGSDPVQCTLQVDGQTVDARTARNGVAVCAWAAVSG